MYINHKSGRNFKKEIDFISPIGKRLILVSLPSERSCKRTNNKNYYVLWGNSREDSSEFGTVEMVTYPKWLNIWWPEKYWRSTGGAIREFHRMIEASKQVNFYKKKKELS